MPLSALAEAAAAPHRRGGIQVEIEVGPAGPQPTVRRSPEIVHGLGNLVQNAVDFATSTVRIVVDWDAEQVRVRVQDDGPGIGSDILSALGEPYVTSRPDGGGMGLGVFIARTLIAHTGGAVRFGNRVEGGCEVAILWPRAILEVAAVAPGARTTEQA
jgi:two-component system sensor histidine kinase RegB